MPALLEITSAREARRRFSWDALWELFDGDREHLNLTHECVDRHPAGDTALRIQRADGGREMVTFGELSAASSRFANLLARDGVAPGDRVAIMLEPSPGFYAALFGTLKRGAVAVPLFTLFGPDGVGRRVDDCRPRLLIVPDDAPRWQARFPLIAIRAADDIAAGAAAEPDRYVPATRTDDLALLQYTSGTTRALPEAIRHTHRSVVTLMIAALYGIGLTPGDRYFCPSSPAWGHGMWHGTIAPLALGIAAGAYAGKFDAGRLMDALEAFDITNIAAAPTVYRLVRDSGLAERSAWRPRKISFTGEPLDSRTFEWIERTWGVRPCGMYGSTEVGVIIVNYPGFTDHDVCAGALGMAAPGWDVAIVGADGAPLPPGESGEIAVRRKGAWFLVKDRGSMDADGYFRHAGRSDDAIVSAGWTMSAVEIEDTMLKHPDVREAAVIGVADETRGQVPRAFVVSERHGETFTHELQEFVRARLSRHEYPREVVVVAALPKTPAGKVDRRALREASVRRQT